MRRRRSVAHWRVCACVRAGVRVCMLMWPPSPPAPPVFRNAHAHKDSFNRLMATSALAILSPEHWLPFRRAPPPYRAPSQPSYKARTMDGRSRVCLYGSELDTCAKNGVVVRGRSLPLFFPLSMPSHIFSTTTSFPYIHTLAHILFLSTLPRPNSLEMSA